MNDRTLTAPQQSAALSFPLLPTISRLDVLLTGLVARARRDGNTPRAFPPGRSPSNDERTAAMQTVNLVRLRLHRLADTADVGRALDMLFTGLKAPAGVDPKTTVAVYGLAIEGVSSAALEQAVRDLLRGQAPASYSQTFAPSAPELRQYALSIEQGWRARADTLEAVLDLPEDAAKPAEPELTPEQRAALQERIRLLTANARPRPAQGQSPVHAGDRGHMQRVLDATREKREARLAKERAERERDG